MKQTIGSAGGVRVRALNGMSAWKVREEALQWFAGLGIPTPAFNCGLGDRPEPVVELQLAPKYADSWLPGGDTLGLTQRLGLSSVSDRDLEHEILVAMLGSPIAFEFPSLAEFKASVRVRKHIVKASRVTALTFATRAAERPVHFWRYVEERGFLVLPGQPLEKALLYATQPDTSGHTYSFSCYRATEYVILLALAHELEIINPELLQRLQQQFETRAIVSGEFHRVFLKEYGSRSDPLPIRYYVPGDRVWFRNPDCQSSDASGFEGSWVFYQGAGQFSNFWKRDKHFSLMTKCLEIYHWRHSTFRDAAGMLRMNEANVDRLVGESLKSSEAVAAIESQMLVRQDPAGVYAEGGCIDHSREYPVCICPGTANLILPDLLPRTAAAPFMPCNALGADLEKPEVNEH